MTSLPRVLLSQRDVPLDIRQLFISNEWRGHGFNVCSYQASHDIPLFNDHKWQRRDEGFSWGVIASDNSMFPLTLCWASIIPYVYDWFAYYWQTSIIDTRQWYYYWPRDLVFCVSIDLRQRREALEPALSIINPLSWKILVSIQFVSMQDTNYMK